MIVPPRYRSGLRRTAQVLVVGVFAAVLVWSIEGRWSDVKDVIGELTIRALVASLIAVLFGVWCTFMGWRVILVDFGHTIPIKAGMRIFFVGQLAKYLPGKVWPVVTQMRLGQSWGVPGRSSAAAALVAMLMGFGSALLVAACSFPFLDSVTFAKYWWILLVLPISIALLWPGVVNRLLNWGIKRLHRDPLPSALSAGAIAKSAIWTTVSWLAFGASLWILLIDLGANAPALGVRSVGAFAGSWAIGFMLSIVPAGLGAREVALVSFLGATVGEPIALVAAVVSRLILTVADLLWPAAAMLVSRPPGLRPAPTSRLAEATEPDTSSIEGRDGSIQ